LNFAASLKTESVKIKIELISIKNHLNRKCFFILIGKMVIALSMKRIKKKTGRKMPVEIFRIKQKFFIIFLLVLFMIFPRATNKKIIQFKQKMDDLYIFYHHGFFV
jgi:hypothetical protein